MRERERERERGRERESKKVRERERERERIRELYCVLPVSQYSNSFAIKLKEKRTEHENGLQNRE